MRRLFPTALFAALLAFALVGGARAHSQDCPAGPFETDLSRLARPSANSQLDQLAWGERPFNYSLLVNGKRADYAGAHLNDGLSSTWVFDFERGTLTELERRKGKYNVDIAPSPATLKSNQQQRRRGDGDAVEVETMTVWTFTPDELREFACLANTALIAPPPPPPPVEELAPPFPWWQTWGYRLRLLKPPPPIEVVPTPPSWSMDETDTLWSSQDLLVNGRTTYPPAVDAEALSGAMNEVIFRAPKKARGY